MCAIAPCFNAVAPLPLWGNYGNSIGYQNLTIRCDKHLDLYQIHGTVHGRSAQPTLIL